MVNRRSLLVGAALGLSQLAGADHARPAPRLPPLRPGEWLKTPNFSLLADSPWRVGLRPHRDGGVRLEVEQDAAIAASGKILIHNYGHSGAGITLGWGCADRVAHLAANALRDQTQKDAATSRFAVVGAGIAGLTSAAEIKRLWPRAEVAIYAKTVSESGRPELDRTTSWIAGGQFEPSGIWRQYRPTASRPDRMSELHDLVRRSHRRIFEIKRQGKARQYGIVDRKNYILDGEDARGFELGIPREITGPGRHGMLPFRSLAQVSGKEYQSWLINPTILMPRLVADLDAAGARFVRRSFDTRADLLALDADVIVNCTGLGSRAILNVEDLHARRGQLVILKNPDQLKYMFSGGCGQETAYLFARQDDIVVGGTFHACESVTDLPEDSYRAVLHRMQRIFAGDISDCRDTAPTLPPAACHL